jgi:hypothetical protein
MEKEFNFKIIKNDCTNIAELIDLAKTYYHEGDIINKEYLKWQYLKNPSGKPFLFVSYEINKNEIAGQYLVIPIIYVVMGKPISGTLSLNTLTKPKFQGKGLFTKMAKITYENCVSNNALFTVGFPNPQSYPGFVRKLGFKHLGDIPLLIKPLKYGRIIFSYFKKSKKKHGGSIKIQNINTKNIKLLNFNDNKIKNKYNKFWNSISKQYKISTWKDFTFLKWRYNDLPTRKYKIFYYEEEKKIKGIIVIKAEKVWGFNVGLIMDILISGNDLSVGKQLLKYTKKVLRQSNLDFIAMLHSGNNEYNILKKSGYFKVSQKILPQKIHFIVKLNKEFPSSEMLFNLQNWKLTFGDYDVF